MDNTPKQNLPIFKKYILYPPPIPVENLRNMFREMSTTVSKKIIRVLNIRLATVLLPLLYKHFDDSITLLMMLSILLVLFQHTHLNMFQELVLTLIINILVKLTTDFESGMGDIFVVYNLSVVFIILQSVTVWIPQDFSARIMGNVQWIYSAAITTSLKKYVQNDIITTLLLVTVVTILRLIQIDNEQFTAIYSMASVQTVQELLMQSIPIIFLLPTSVCLIYISQAFVHYMGTGDDMHEFIVFSTASIVNTQLRTKVELDVSFYIATLALVIFSTLQMKKAESVAQIITLLAFMDIVADNIQPLYASEPLFSLLVITFAVRALTSFLT